MRREIKDKAKEKKDKSGRRKIIEVREKKDKKKKNHGKAEEGRKGQ